MHAVLSTTADIAARRSHFVQRPRRAKFTGSTFVQTLVFGWLADPAASLDSLAQTAAAVGVPVTPQALDQRFTPAAAPCLQEVLAATLQRPDAADPVAVPLLQRFPHVVVQDSSTIVLPNALTEVWRGCGGDVQYQTQASVKLGVQFDLTTGALLGPFLEHGRTHDRASQVQHVCLPAGSLRITDTGFVHLPLLTDLNAAGVFWLSRLHSNVTVYDGAGRMLDLAYGRCAERPYIDEPMYLGKTQRVPARLLAVRVLPEVANQRRRRLRLDAQRRSQPISARRLALADWTSLITNVPLEDLSLEEALVLMRARWQIELLFKLWKSYGKIDEWRSAKPWRILCEVYAKLIAMVIQHWLLLVSSWAYVNRSLTKAAQTVRAHARHLASVLVSRPQLTTALATIVRCLERSGRMNTRKTKPNTYQLLLDVPALSMIA